VAASDSQNTAMYSLWLQQRFIETYTRIFSGLCLVAATKGYTLRHFDSLRSSLFRFLSGKRESREGSGTEVTKKCIALYSHT